MGRERRRDRERGRGVGGGTEKCHRERERGGGEENSVTVDSLSFRYDLCKEKDMKNCKRKYSINFQL